MNDLGKFKRYRIGEAAHELGVKTSVLRFWEGEFGQLEPVRTASGQRLYTKDHLLLLKRIKSLLYDEGLTIEGARKRLEDGISSEFLSVQGAYEISVPCESVVMDGISPQRQESVFLREVADELRSILKMLERS